MGGLPYINDSLKGFQGIGTKRLYTHSLMFKWMMMPRGGHGLAVMRFCAPVGSSAAGGPRPEESQRQHPPEGGGQHAERLTTRGLKR